MFSVWILLAVVVAIMAYTVLSIVEEFACKE